MQKAQHAGIFVSIEKRKITQWAGIATICVLALIPLFRIIAILLSTGTDTISNDYLRFVSLADKVLSPGYDWGGYFKDSFDNNVHSYAFLFLFRLTLARLTQLSVLAEIAVGLMLFLVNLVLSFHMITRATGVRSVYRFLLLPFLAALTFSVSQISTFGFGETVLQMGFTHFWILVGLSLLLFRGQARFITWGMILCGILASYSGGSGLLAWPIFLLAVLATDRRNPRKILGWVAGLLVGSAPYFAFSNFDWLKGIGSGLNPKIILKVVTGLGLPLVNDIRGGVVNHPGALATGMVGLVIMLIFTLLVATSRVKNRVRMTLPAFLLILWGLGGAVQIALSRESLAPWYNSTYILFWIGLVSLGTVLLLPAFSAPASLSLWKGWVRFAKWFSVLGLAVVVVLYIHSNRTYEDKDFYLSSRSPATQACLSDYLDAPTYCEGFVFQWGVGNPAYLVQMGSILEKFHWSVRGEHRERTLQGDMVLGKVKALQDTIPADIHWVMGGTGALAFWLDFRHLDVFLLPGQKLFWEVDLPGDLRQAQFQMGVSLPDFQSCGEQSFSLSIRAPGETENPLVQQKGLCDFRQGKAMREDLLSFAGKTVVISITNDRDGPAGKPIRLEYPKISLIDEMKPSFGGLFPRAAAPLNSDLSAKFVVPGATALSLMPSESGRPDLQDFQAQTGDGRLQRTGPLPVVGYTPTQPVCFQNRSKLYFRLALTDRIRRKMVRLKFHFLSPNADLYDTSSDFPLLAGEDLHAYTFDFGLYQLPPSVCLSRVEFQFIDRAGNYGGQWMQVQDVKILP